VNAYLAALDLPVTELALTFLLACVPVAVHRAVLRRVDAMAPDDPSRPAAVRLSLALVALAAGSVLVWAVVQAVSPDVAGLRWLPLTAAVVVLGALAPDARGLVAETRAVAVTR
jgi:hypothetical protein